MTTTADPLVFVYFKVRGKMQPIRNLVLYLNVPFIEVHLDDEQQKKTLPEEVLKSLKGLRIEKSLLPLLVYQGRYIYDIYPIMAFICRRFKREDLLGKDIRQRARLQEMLEIFVLHQPNSMNQLFKLADYCADHKHQEIMREKKAYLDKFLNQSGYLKEICVYLQRQGCGANFTLQTVTILDFLFLQSCHYMLGMFNTLDQKQLCPITHLLLDFFTGPQDTPPAEFKYLETMRNYLSFMYGLPFYSSNRDYLQGFSIISNSCTAFTDKRIKGIKKMWSHNKAFIK